MRHCQSGWVKMSVAHVGLDTEYLIDMLDGMFGVPVYSEAEDEQRKMPATKRAAPEPEGHPGLSRHLSYSQEIEYITHPGFPVETKFGIKGMINKLETVEREEVCILLQHPDLQQALTKQNNPH